MALMVHELDEPPLLLILPWRTCPAEVDRRAVWREVPCPTYHEARFHELPPPAALLPHCRTGCTIHVPPVDSTDGKRKIVPPLDVGFAGTVQSAERLVICDVVDHQLESHQPLGRGTGDVASADVLGASDTAPEVAVTGYGTTAE